jgi:hypothetical protein
VIFAHETLTLAENLIMATVILALIGLVALMVWTER